MNETFKHILSKSIDILLIIGFFYIVNLLIDRIMNKIQKRKKNKSFNTVWLFFKRLKKIILYSLAIIICLSRFETFSTLSVTILSGIGIITTVLGLAAKDALMNFFGSLGLVFAGPFEVGDFIQCIDKDISGTVEEITMRHTIVKTIKNKRVVVPNSVMNNLAIENYNRSDNEVCMFAEYPISYESDVDKAIKILEEESKKLYKPISEYNKNVEFPKVRLISWDASGITLRSWIWGKDSGDAFENLFKLNYVVKKRFEEENIEIPYNHMEVILDKNKKNK